MPNFEKEQTATPEKELLLEQFDNPKKLTLGGKEIDVVDISPETRKTEVPTVVTPGFSANPLALKDSILRTAEAGRRVLSAYAPHGIDIEDKRADLPEAELRKLELLIQMVDASGISKVSVIANSESSIYVTAAALLYPEKFSNIVLVEPAGLIGDDSFFQLIGRVMEDAKLQKERAPLMTQVEYPSPDVGTQSILSDIPASIKEVIAIAHSDITKVLEKIHQAGVGISIIHAVDDKIFPMERVQTMVKAGMIDGFYSVTGTHNSIYNFEPYGRAAEAALSALENKKLLNS